MVLQKYGGKKRKGSMETVNGTNEKKIKAKKVTLESNNTGLYKVVKRTTR